METKVEYEEFVQRRTYGRDQPLLLGRQEQPRSSGDGKTKRRGQAARLRVVNNESRRFDLDREADGFSFTEAEIGPTDHGRDVVWSGLISIQDSRFTLMASCATAGGISTTPKNAGRMLRSEI